MKEFPEEIKEFQNVETWNKERKKYYIYLLYNKDKLRYVGRTRTHPIRRSTGHTNKRFTDLYYYTLDTKPEWKAEERRLILKYRPLYNYNGHYHRKPKKSI